MDTQKPFIHLIKTPLGHYVYDVNSGAVLAVQGDTYEILDRFMKDEKGALLQENSEIEHLRASGYLSNNRPKKIEHPVTPFLRAELEENIEQITIQLTQQCNFRCDYCVYAVRDFEQQRTHAAKRISEPTARKAIDFLAEHSGERTDVCVGFYGGEPLLEFQLLKRLVVYAEERLAGKKTRYTITTNASLLHEEEAAFLEAHNFSVTISLDGSRKAHDRTRRYAATGSGTYDDVIRNIQMIFSSHPKLAAQLLFNVVIDPRFPCDDLYQEIDQNPVFQASNTQTTLINDAFDVEKTVEDERFHLQNYEHITKALLALIGRYPPERVSIAARREVGAAKERIERTMTRVWPLGDTAAHGGPCIPGQKRLFVNCDGLLFPCERVSETSECMCIGSLDSGFDYEKADQLLDIGKLTEESCKNCWLLRLCDICAQKCDNGGKLSAELKQRNCLLQEANQQSTLQEYLFFREFGIIG